jgi:hypothetical protein
MATVVQIVRSEDGRHAASGNDVVELEVIERVAGLVVEVGCEHEDSC